MKTQLFISRNFVEFGPFSGKELLEFGARGVFIPTDYVREANSDTWITFGDWSATITAAPAKKAAPKAAAPKRKKAA